MVRDIKIIDYLPQVLKEVKEIKAINSVENNILEQEWIFAFQQLENQFVEYADEDGIKRYEKMLGLKYLDTDSLETRRLRILSYFQRQAPYTYKVLIRILNSLLGEGEYTIQRNVATKELNIKLNLDVKAQFNILAEILESIVPVDMTINLGLLYNNHHTLSAYTHEELAQFTYQYLREGVLS